ncbi:MAG TPA: ribonuclease H-like domain-containing protein [Candidatus Hydrogenedentes bacterium]|nr:ribonuclease H-like domain-containing protein [Candidatus Hydrogenedentota bacterium]
MTNARDKLASLLSTPGLMKGADWQQKLETLRQERESGEFEIDKVQPGLIVGETDRGFFLVSETFPLDTAQGNIDLGAVLNVCGDHIALSSSDDALKAFDPRKALFIDTETSGLAGGTGTVAFLVGVGYFTEDGFRLDQCFMRDFDDEEPMLEYLAEVFKDKEAVVSYNGKSFDLPLLRTRFIQNRIPFRLDSGMHFDLLHAARRFWKRRLGACNLGNVEREILGIERHGDVPSYMIPQLWFDYLRSRDARPLTGVLYHHKMDILSLVALAGWLSQCLCQPNGEGFTHTEDKFSLVKVFFNQKRYQDVIVHGERIIADERDTGLRRECLEMLAIASKRLNDFPRMQDILTLMVTEYPSDLNARWELAKHYEHRARNLAEAERICSEAISQLETRIALGRALGVSESMLASFEHRLARIRSKMKRLSSPE